jgi:hypothetical protein
MEVTGASHTGSDAPNTKKKHQPRQSVQNVRASALLTP